VTDFDSFDLTSMQVAEPEHGIQMGHGLVKVHPRTACAGRGLPCVIHSPSEHHMREWPLNWRSDTRVMERVCPHGVGHPDPDHMTYVRSLTPEHLCPDQQRPYDTARLCIYPHLESQGIHGCDGCCVKS
jgi:hypothetical protein